MKKAVMISTILLYLFSTTEFSQFLRIPIVIEHYFEHKQFNKDISFLQFFSIHYIDDFVIDADVARDMELPFKSCNHTTSNTFFAVEVDLKQNSAYNLDLFSETLHLSKIFNSPPFDFFPKIWQPPKFA